MTMIRKMMILCLASGLAAGCQQSGEEAAPANETAATSAQPEQSGRSIGDALAQSDEHSQFMQTVESAGLTETLRGAGPYTVFAPANAAFEALPEDARSGLAAPENRQRTAELLSHHIVPGTVTAQDIGRAVESGEGGRAELATMAGGTLTASREEGAIVISDGAGGQARIVQPDQIHSNGIVHGIDGVLRPATE